MATPTTNDYFLKVGTPGSATTLAAPGFTAGGTTINVGSTAGFPTDTAVIFAIDTVTTTSGQQVRTNGSYTVYAGIVTSATSIGSVTLLSGTAQNYAAGASTRVYITVSTLHTNRLISGLLQSHNQDGSLIGSAVRAALGQTSSTGAGWQTMGVTLSNGTYNGNRSYTFNTSTDQTTTLSNGMRLMTQRTVAAPTQCASLNGTSQYLNRTATINGMTFTDKFTVSAWIKPTAYPGSAGEVILSRFNGTSGWDLSITQSGQIQLAGRNGAQNNYSIVLSYQSVPLNKWIHVSATLDMAAFTANNTTGSWVMVDGVDVPCSVGRGGTNPTSLVQLGNLEIGSWNGGLLPFTGKIAQVAVFSAKITESTIQSYISQGLQGTETNLISAFSLSGANGLNDLNTTNANNLTANGSATTTTTDAPWTQQANATPNGTLDYGILTKITSTQLTIQVPEGCTLPTSGGISAVSYASVKVPYGFPSQRNKWRVKMLSKIIVTQSSASNGTWYNAGNLQLAVPVGEWVGKYSGSGYVANPVNTPSLFSTLSIANNSETDTESTARVVFGNTNNWSMAASIFREIPSISLAAATTYYLNVKTDQNGSPTLQWGPSAEPTIIEAELAYL